MSEAIIAAGVISALSIVATKGLEKLAEKTAEEGFNERRKIWETVKSLFKADDLTLLNLLKDANSDLKAQGKLEGKLETYLEANPEIAKELEALLKKIPVFEVKQNTLTQIGEGNIGIQDTQESIIKINK